MSHWGDASCDGEAMVRRSTELARGTDRGSIVRFIAAERSFKPGSKPYPREYAERIVERVEGRKLERTR
jgi:hypothetical protein